MAELSKAISEMHQRIGSKLGASGANSKDKAVSAQEADLDFP